MANIKEILQNVRELFSDPKKWCKVEVCYGPNKKRMRTAALPYVSSDPDTEQWCLIGAVWKFSKPGFGVDVYEVLNIAQKQLFPNFDNAIVFADNKNTSHQQLLSVIDKALELVEGASNE